MHMVCLGVRVQVRGASTLATLSVSRGVRAKGASTICLSLSLACTRVRGLYHPRASVSLLQVVEACVVVVVPGHVVKSGYKLV